ncbi:hypothetical protein ABGB12_32015 [Actinocorallia sp. B10E7]|uniref:hypothetical protein n=1 Tax=Actinocorallia sp. B10E7 TaxID=3153558 RepID=UPI00325C39BB
MTGRGLAVALTGALTLSLAVAAPAAAAEPRLGPYGYGKLKIGQTKSQARGTGLIVLKRRDGGCTGFDLKTHRTGRDQVGGYISKKFGVVAIFARKGMKTPRGITLGSTKAQVKKAYPALREDINVWWVPAPGSKKKTQYWFLFDRKNKVYELGLVSPKQDCFN